MPIDLITGSDTPDEGFEKINDNFVDLDTAINNLETDVASLEGDGVGGVTDHGLLTGLSDDDHAQYSLSDGTRVKIPRSSTAPNTANVNLYIDTSVSPHTLKSWNGTAWEAISYEGAGVGSSGVVEDFEDATLGFTFTGPWTRDDEFAHTGSWSFKSPATAEGATSEVTTNIVIPADSVDASVSFWYRVDSEASSDYFRFFVDSTQELEESGFVNWTFFTLPLAVGSYTLKFRYVKDSSGTSSGDDAAWIDDLNVSFTVPGAFGGGGGGGGGAAEDITFTPAGTIAATDVQAAIEEVASEAGGSVSAASETVAGIAEVATQTETNTGTDDARIVTPLKAATRFLAKAGGTLTGFLTLHADPTSALHAVTKQYADGLVSGGASPASETTAGIAEVATQTETNTGTDDTRIVTPLKLANYTGLGSGGFTPDYVAQSGSSALFSAWGDGNPVRALDKANGSVSAGPTPTQLGTTVARCVRFRLPVNLSVSHVYLHGNAVTTGIYTLAIYPVGTGSSRLWNPGAINTTSQSVVDLTADTPFSLTANTNYWMCISANTTGTTAGVSSPEAPILGLYGADAAPFGNTSIGIPVLAQFAVTAGAMPSTLPAVAAMGSWTRSVPIFLFAGTPS